MAATPFTIGVRRRLPWGGASALAVIAALLSVTGVGVAATDSDAALRRHQAPLLDPQAPDGRRAQPPADHEHHHALAATALATTAPLAPKRGGSWEYGTPFENRFNAVHTVAGAGGKILEIAGSGNSSDEFEAGSFRTFLWDTVTDTRREIATPDDMFCAGHVLLPDGRALVGGGTTAYSPFKGSRRLYAFDFVQERYERLTDMEVGRWYPSLVTDWLGRTLIVGGLDENGINTQVTERFDYRTDTLTRLASTRRFSLYPQIHLASRKRMFVAERSDGQEPGFWDPSAAKRFVPVRGHTDGGRRGGAASCFIGDVRDQRLMIMGGGWPATDSTNVIDLDAASPAYKPGPSLHEPKAYVSCVNLPTGGLLEAHGGTANQVDAASSEVARLNATGTGWVPLNPLPDGEHRLYHSMLFLLDNGQVASLTSNPKDGAWSTTLLMYKPPYLFKGPRPVITRAPVNVARGGTYRVAATTPGSTLTRVTLTAPPSPTHSVEPNQRYVSMDVTGGRFTIPGSSSILPPGKYRLWAVNAVGVPSVARWITLT